jgi:drug/metabolite transporter (DMT)-like permease
MCLVFGGSYIAMKAALETVNPMQVVLIRYVMGAIILYSVYFLQKNKQKIKPEDLKYMILLGLLEPGLFFIFDAYGLKYTTPVRATIIISTVPVITAFLAVPFLKEKLTPLKLFASAGTIIGVAIVVSSSEPTEYGSKYLLGDFLIMIACIAASFYTVFARKFSFKYSFFTITRFQSIIAVAFFLPLALIETKIKGLLTPSQTSIIGILYLGIFSSVCGYLLLNYTIANLSAANSSIFANLIPVVTMILSAFILKEFIGINKIVGLFVVLFFVFLLSWRERHR